MKEFVSLQKWKKREKKKKKGKKKKKNKKNKKISKPQQTCALPILGGAQPLAITMNEGVCLAAEVEEWRIRKRVETKYIDEIIHDIDEAIDRAVKYKSEGKAISIGVVCNAVDLLERLIARNITPD